SLALNSDNQYLGLKFSVVFILLNVFNPRYISNIFKKLTTQSKAICLKVLMRIIIFLKLKSLQIPCNHGIFSAAFPRYEKLYFCKQCCKTLSRYSAAFSLFSFAISISYTQKFKVF